jgi:hypothetical protein
MRSRASGATRARSAPHEHSWTRWWNDSDLTGTSRAAVEASVGLAAMRELFAQVICPIVERRLGHRAPRS